jgi:hypothetical protein
VAGRNKLGPKYYGPFQVTEKLGTVAYRLQLPKGAKLHDVFHVGLLKKYYGQPPEGPGVLPPIRHGRACLEPAKVTHCKLARGREEVLVRWVGQSATDASWVALDEFWKTYRALQLQDELILQAGRDVMYGRTYQRRNKKPVGAEGAHVRERVPDSDERSPKRLGSFVTIIKSIRFP